MILTGCGKAGCQKSLSPQINHHFKYNKIMCDENVCKHFKVGYCKYGLKCRHKPFKKECQKTYCNKKCKNIHQNIEVSLPF